MLQITLMFFFIYTISAQSDNKIDFNQADMSDLQKLPLSQSMIQSLYDFKLSHGRIKSLNDLLEVQFMTIDSLDLIRPYLSNDQNTNEDFRIDNIELINSKFKLLFSKEINPNLADFLVENTRIQSSINQMSYSQIANLPFVSVIDATYLTKYLQNNKIKNTLELKKVDGLSLFNYEKIKDFINYEDIIINDNFLRGIYTYRQFDSPIYGEQGNINYYNSTKNLQKISHYSQFHKLRINYNNFTFGLSNNRNLGESFQKEFKFYLSFKNFEFEDLLLEELIVGNYSINFGQGLTIGSSGFFTPRKDGFLLKKYYDGIFGDNSRNRSNELFGVAAKLRFIDKLEIVFFTSKSNRDAILNLDGSVNMFINLNQRFSEDYLFHYKLINDQTRQSNTEPQIKDSVPNMLKKISAFTFGGELKWLFSPGNFISINLVEEWYNKLLRPNVNSLFNTELTNEDRKNFINNELVQGIYGGENTDFNGGNYKSFRRVYGFSGQFVLNDLVFKTEYSILDTESKRDASFTNLDLNNKKNDTFKPRVFVFSTQLQKDNFDIVLMYRDYDLAYDNPYQQSFANFQKFKGTVLNEVRNLKSPYYTQLYYSSTQAQAERGIHLNSSLRLNKVLNIYNESDIWERVSDATQHIRITFRTQYQAFQNFRIELRQKWQKRSNEAIYSNDYLSKIETFINIETLINARNNLVLSVGQTISQYPIRSDLFINGNFDSSPSEEFKSNLLAINYVHEFSLDFNLNVGLSYSDGFYNAFEDSPFSVLNTASVAYRTHFSLYNRFSSNLALRLKLSHKFDFDNSTSSISNSVINSSYFEDYLKFENLDKGTNMFLELVISF